jgi:DNA polymerase-3 subunit alpha
VRNLGGNGLEAVLAARRQVGRFRTLVEFCENVDLSALNRRILENLIKCGAMDSLEGTRAQQTAILDRAVEIGQRALKDRQSGQGGLFAEWAVSEADAVPLPPVPDFSQKEKLAGEKETIGLYVTGHPLDEFAAKVADLATHDSSKLEDLERNAEVALCGVVTNIQRKRNKDGRLWASFQLDDGKGVAECMAFHTVFEHVSQDLLEDRAVLVRGLALPEDNGPARISVKEVAPLELASVQLPRLVSIRVFLNGKPGGDRADELMRLFERKRGEAEVRLRLEKPRDFSVILDVATRVRPDKEFTAEVERICGPQSMEVLAE